MAIGLRQLIIIALVAAAVWFYKRAQRKRQVPRRSARRAGSDYQDTVRCRYCGVYLPRREAKGDAEHGFRCTDPACEAHRHSHTGSTG